MNQKVSRNEKHKYSNKERLHFGGHENTSAIINITQEDDSNRILTKLVNKQSLIYYLKMF